MYRIVLIISHGCVAQGHLGERSAHEIHNFQDSTDSNISSLGKSKFNSVHDSLKKKADKLVDTLFNRVVRPGGMFRTVMDSTALGKPAQLAMPHRRASLLTPSLVSGNPFVLNAQRFSVPMLRKSKMHHASAFASCPSTSYNLYTQLRRQHGLAPLTRMCAANDGKSPEAVLSKAVVEEDPSWGITQTDFDILGQMECDLDNLNECSTSNLEVMYIDALWDYYANGRTSMSDAQFDKIKMELNWQGSGVPTLKRNEIKFVEASIAYARNEPIITDEEYEKLKSEIKSNGKRKEVTSFLLYVKGMKNLNPDQFQTLQRTMDGQGIQVSPTGAACVLSETPPNLQNDVLDTISMYTALGVLPTTICTGAFYLLSFILNTDDILALWAATDFIPTSDDVLIPGLGVAGLSSVALTAQLVRYLGLTSPQILTGVCPCCEAEIRQLASDFTGKQVVAKCEACATQVGFNAETLLIENAGDLQYLNSQTKLQDSASSLSRDWDILINKAALGAVQSVAGKSAGEKLGGMKPMSKEEKEKAKKEKATSKMQVIQKGVKEGIFAWAVLLGIGIFGEQFIQKLRAKGIQIHSSTINDFCERFAIPAVLRKKYVENAKRIGHELGFLVQGQKQFGDGLFGKQALKFWKAQGW